MKSFKIYVFPLAAAFPLVFVSGASAFSRHVVSPGETLSYLAQVYVVTVGEVADLNGITNPDIIFPGQELLIPGGSDTGASQSPGGGGSYTVQPGDTLSAIAYRYGVATDDLIAANSLEDADFIAIGQTLAIPGAAPPPDTAEAVYTFTPLGFPPQPYDPDVEAIIDEMSYAYGVDPRLVKALATVESGWNQYALSYVGAQGVMQIMPGTALWLEQDVFGHEMYEDASAYDNIKMGVKYLAILLDATGGDEHLTVASYYQGLSPTQQGVFYPDTEDYVQMIFRVRDGYF